MDIKDLKMLIKMVTETDITEFELENAEDKVVIKRGCSSAAPQFQMQAPVYQYAPTAPAAPAAAAAPAATPAAAEKEQGDVITSPIVGTFYRSPAPDAAPYVEVGQIVEKGQVLCIVEAMKLMNEIEAEFKCKIVKISKENAQPVEYGDALFVVEKL
ncbi:acetyl-CoA carboxylase, biotin carboxyl carrier protein [Citrifermentans bemidjiense Bem]|uniref:Biotin carboxyl carrier protein of acetyl-CoA carboxylase n=1 Tax=Citrifermentans bemidjiense (strain ATCC BAA-1014 / DSM 16622 / JCM 12645 / Bem) TaxID=404380 RepID=B5E8J4_CITBB|nr:acetyl-CoA carboxylase biotin carboxyl carrier protein [Citrifermentans bemidjiense]ACH38579.1 acetyl-CoA carboxylase, biotin carboxyl carrier protein [Citrifermentans bemidjiense Bem]